MENRENGGKVAFPQNKILRIAVSVVIALVIAAAAFCAGFFTRKFTQGRELSSFEWALGIIEKNYYYGGVNGEVVDIAVSAIAENYLDRYSQYYTAEEYAQALASNAGSKSGIGVSYSFVNGRGVFINSVTGNSPACKSGLRAGEWLSGGAVADGEEIVFESADDFKNLIASTGDGVEITLSATDGAQYSVAPAVYTASYTEMYTSSSKWYFADAAEGGLALYETNSDMDFLPDGTAYLSLAQFYGTAASEFAVLIEKFNATGCTSLILDLRSDGGGYVNVMQNIAGAFSGGQKKVAMISRNKNGKEEKFYCNPLPAEKSVAKGTKVYVLANSGTASASEALIGALVCYGAVEYKNIFLSDYGAEYIDWLKATGQEVKTAQTFGKGIMQSTFVNSSTGEALKLTTAQIYWPDGTTCIHDRGVTTEDGCTPVQTDWIMTKGDAELRAVVEKIKSL